MSEFKIRIDISLEQYGDLCYVFGVLKEHLIQAAPDSKIQKLLELLELIQKTAKCTVTEEEIVTLPKGFTEVYPTITPAILKDNGYEEIKLPPSAHTKEINFKSKMPHAFGKKDEPKFEKLSPIEQIKQKQEESKTLTEAIIETAGVVPSFIAPEKGEEKIQESKALYLTSREVAQLLGVSETCVHSWRSPKSNRNIPHKYIEGRIRYKLSDVTAFQKFWKKRDVKKTND